MARKKTSNVTQAEEAGKALITEKTVVFWKATRPLTVQEHEDLSEKARYEEKQTGLTIMLVPFSVEAGVE